MRRSLLFLLGLIASMFAMTAAANAVTFTNGVASGDVTSSKAILWTRVSGAATIKVEVWPNPGLTGKKAFQRNVTTTAPGDFIGKVDATGLSPATTYYFRWKDTSTENGPRSPVGTSKTAPSPTTPANVKFTYTGDSDGFPAFGSGCFNNFETLDRARQEAGDFFVYLGDTIYSDSSCRPGGPATTLADYRDAYRINRNYPNLSNLLASTSTYAQLDDHEVYNDFDGQNVDPARYAAGRRAFFDWLPLRDSDVLHDSSCAGDPIFQKYQWGSQADLIVLDERSCRSPDAAATCQGDLAPTLFAFVRTNFGLPASPPPGCLAEINDPGRTLLGPVQKQALKNALSGSSAKWKFIINPEPIQQFYALPYDRWEGYAAERTEILHYIRDNNIQNVVFLTTDTHATIQNQVPVDTFFEPASRGEEFVTGPIATNTFQQEVLAFGGQFALTGINFLLTFSGVDCRDIDTPSYGVVDVNATSGTATVTSKDDTGATITNQVGPFNSCGRTLGP